MLYLYERSRGIVDLILPRHYTRSIRIMDGESGGGDYVAVLDGEVFVVTDPNANAISSAAIATSLAALIDASDNFTATDSGQEVIVTHVNPAKMFQIRVFTTDAGGGIYYRETPPQAYKIKRASSFSGVFADILTIPQQGYRSSTLQHPTPAADFNHPTQIRARFSLADVSLGDDVVHYLTVSPIVSGVEGTPSSIYILLTPEQMLENHTALALVGNAPLGASIADSLELTFPYQATSIVITNDDGANDLYVSFGEGAGELVLGPGETFRDNRFGNWNVALRGDAAAVPVSIYVSLNNQKFI